MTSSRRSAGEPLLGHEVPRLWTRPLRELTPETSLGFEAIEFAELLGRRLHPWQKWFLIHSMELALGSHSWDEYPVFRFRTVVLEVARQNGKSFIMSTRLLWRMFMWDGPEAEAPLILGVAHKLSAAEEILELSKKAVQRSDEFSGQLARVSNVNGNKFFELDEGARYKCEASSDDVGRGLSVTDLAFDELRQQRDWDAWSAATNTTNAIFSSQTIAVSNAGEAKSDVLRSVREQGLKGIETYEKYVASGVLTAEEYANGHDVTLGLFEWSAPDDCDIWDRDGWAAANPSLGWSDALTEDVIASKAALVGVPGKGMPEHKFRTEILCQWVTVAAESFWAREDVDQVFALDPDEDGELTVPSEIDPASEIALAVDVSHDRKAAYIGVAGWRTDGKPHVELLARLPGTEGVVRYLQDRLAFTPDTVAVQGRGAPASSLIEYIEAAGFEVTRCEGTGLGAAMGLFSDRVVAGSVKAPADAEALHLAMSEVVVKSLGEMFVYDRGKSPVDVAPLCMAAIAVWALEALGRAPEKKASAYDDEHFGGWQAPKEEDMVPAGVVVDEDDDERWW